MIDQLLLSYRFYGSGITGMYFFIFTSCLMLIVNKQILHCAQTTKWKENKQTNKTKQLGNKRTKPLFFSEPIMVISLSHMENLIGISLRHF